MKPLCLLLILFNASTLFAQPGTLDNTFGVGGIAFSPFVAMFSYAHAIALQPDGKILATGHIYMNGHFRIFVVRYNSDGSFDPSFPDVVTSINSASEYARAIAVQDDGKIVVAGHLDGTNSAFLVIRLTSSGAYDNTFGTAGIVTSDFGASSINETNSMVIQPDGKILIAGWTSSGDKDIALLRFNSDGSADNTFGVDGKVSTDLNNAIQEAHEVALQPDGKIIVAGFTFSPLSANDVVVLRYNSNGSLDLSFGTNGVALPVINNDDDAAFSMVLQPDGKIVTAGYTYTNYTYADNLIVRFDSTGNLDASFNGTGVVAANNGNVDHLATGVLLQPDGKIVITGRAFPQFTLDFMLARFNSNGSLDSSFGVDGYTYTPVALEDDYILASLLQPDGKIVVTGYYTDSGIENFLLARYTNDVSTGIKEIDPNDVLLYPQPADDIIHVRLNERINNPVEASVYSITSTRLRTVSAGHEFSIETADLPTGIYLLRITDRENNLITRKTFVVD